jgi:hypothetical protein
MLYSSGFLSIAVNIDGVLADQVGAVLGIIEKEYARAARLPCWQCRRSLRAIGLPWGVGGARGGEKGHAGRSPVLRKPGRGDDGDGKEDQYACGAVAQGGPNAGCAGAEELDGILAGNN